jgi:hypothetical protein
MMSAGTGVTAGRAEADASIKMHTLAATLPEMIDTQHGLGEVGGSNGRMIYGGKRRLKRSPVTVTRLRAALPRITARVITLWTARGHLVTGQARFAFLESPG